MKIRVLIPLALMVLLLVPTATADDSAAVSNPLETLYSWAISVWDALLGGGEPSSADGDGDGDEEGEPLPGLGPWIEPHG